MDARSQVGQGVAIIRPSVEQEVLLRPSRTALMLCQAGFDSSCSWKVSRACSLLPIIDVTKTWSGCLLTMYSMSRGVVSEPGLSGVELEAMLDRPS